MSRNSVTAMPWRPIEHEYASAYLTVREKPDAVLWRT